MRARVLGAAAGGGFPQWNCGCEGCALARRGDPRVVPRTQDSVAIRGAESRFYLINASPDILQQIRETPALHARGPRETPVAGVILTNGDLDHVLGLFSLRESQPIRVFATEPVWRGLVDKNAMMRTLARFEGQVTWVKLELDRETRLDDDVAITPFAAPGKLPVHLVGTVQPSPEDNIALAVRFRDRDARLIYAAAAANAGDLPSRVAAKDTLLFDGTFFTSDELIAQGLGKSRAEDMAHLPIGGASGSLAALAGVRAARRIYTHINNTNPILRSGSDEERAVLSAGWEIAFDGMEIDP